MIDRNGSSSNMLRDRKPRGIQTHKADDADWVKNTRFARSEYHSQTFPKEAILFSNYSFFFCAGLPWFAQMSLIVLAKVFW